MRGFPGWKNQKDIESGQGNGMNDNKRRQIIDEYFPHYQNKIKEFFDLEKYSVSKTSIIFNDDDGCDPEELHTDYKNSWRKLFIAKQCFSCILAIMPGTKLIGNVDGEEIVLELDSGDMIVFRGDFKHHEAEHLNFNVRLQYYIDIKGINRKYGETYTAKAFDIAAHTKRMEKCKEDCILGKLHLKRKRCQNRINNAREIKKLKQL